MIVKELDAFASEDPMAKAGRKAEEQMSFYLKRAFAQDADIRIFNGLRLVKGEDVTQIDHLVLHPYGIIIIESKSVTTHIAINAQLEWEVADF